ncbi:MAG: hypothetical protein H6926_00590 [Chromatiales bacterium]|nr:hypothetical protein [Chromatiales bacterium]
MPLRIDLGRSLRLAATLLIVHLLTVWMVWASEFPRSGRWVLSLLIAISMVMVLRRHVLRVGRGAIRQLLWDADGVWRLVDAGGREFLVTRHGEFLRTPWLVILNLRDEGGAGFAAVIPRDAVDGDEFRRLRMRLRVAA